MDLFTNMADFELRREIQAIDALPEGECHPDDLRRRDEMVEALRMRESWS